VVFAACTRVESADAPPDVSVGANGFGGEADGGSGSRAGEAGEQQGGSGVSQAGAPNLIDIGIWPTFAQGVEGADAAAVLASIAALSAGSSVLPVYERWDSLSGATGSPRAVTWDRLDAMFAPYRDRGKALALCIGIVDRTSPAWPFAGELDTDDARAAIERTIDEVFTRYAPQLGHLCFGYEIDRYLAVASNAERERLLAFLAHAVEYAKGRSAGTPMGVAVTLAGAGQPTLLADVALGDEVIAVYDALDEEAGLEAPDVVAGELEAAFEALQTLEGEPRPLTLFEAGYPSGTDAGSSEEQQQAYYEALFAALEPHANQLAFVGLFGLGDRSAPACEMEALAFGVAQEERALVRCSMGLRAESGEPKLAWPSVVSALSRYR
jgi:hypothetical protein